MKLNGEAEALAKWRSYLFDKIQNISRQRNPAFEVRTQAKIFYTHRPGGIPWFATITSDHAKLTKKRDRRILMMATNRY